MRRWYLLGALALSLATSALVDAEDEVLSSEASSASNRIGSPILVGEAAPAVSEYSITPDVEYTVPTPESAEPYFGGYASGRVCEHCCMEPWEWHLLPSAVLYQAYMAGQRESGMNTVFTYDPGLGWQWDSVVGGRVPLFRYGTDDGPYAEGFQLDVEGASFIRMNIEEESDVEATDYRAGVPLTYREGPWEGKLAYYHISSHVGDEFLERYPTFVRNDYLRDAVVLGGAYRWTPDLRLYAEIGYGYNVKGPAEPWEVQFGVEYAKKAPTGWRGHPYAAVNVRLREEVDWGGDITSQLGWGWTGENGHRLRFGFQWWTGQSHQVVFIDDNEQHIGMGLWYDF
jgi:hypothetical protein